MNIGLLDLPPITAGRTRSFAGEAPEPYRTLAGRNVPRPRAVPDAEWQPGVTGGADALRPTLNGEPVPGALAASASQGWVHVAPMDLLRPPRRGVVRLMRVEAGCR